jgi:hypothetical protein
VVRRSDTTALTGIDTTSGHMNQPAVRRAWNRDFPFEDVTSGYTGDESELASPIDRKRKYGAGNSPDFGRHVDSDEEFPDLDQLRQSHRVKQEGKPLFIAEVDLYEVSDQEPHRRELGQRKKARHQSPLPKQFKNPLDVDILFSSQSSQEESSQLPIRSDSKAASFKTPPPKSAEKTGDRGCFHNRPYNTSSPETDADEIEIIKTQCRKISPPKSQSKSPAK